MAISSLSLGVFTVTLIIVPSEASALLLLLLPGSAAPWSAIFTPPMVQLGSRVSFRVTGQTSFQNEFRQESAAQMKCQMFNLQISLNLWFAIK